MLDILGPGSSSLHRPLAQPGALGLSSHLEVTNQLLVRRQGLFPVALPLPCLWVISLTRPAPQVQASWSHLATPVLMTGPTRGLRLQASLWRCLKWQLPSPRLRLLDAVQPKVSMSEMLNVISDAVLFPIMTVFVKGLY